MRSHIVIVLPLKFYCFPLMHCKLLDIRFKIQLKFCLLIFDLSYFLNVCLLKFYSCVAKCAAQVGLILIIN